MSIDAIDAISETAIFERIFRPEESGMSADVAQAILAVDFTPADHERMQVLADKAKSGTLSSREELEIENYERVGHYLAILQSMARRSLKATNSNAR